jgi:AsmA family/AsmA-like C-terminal region
LRIAGFVIALVVTLLVGGLLVVPHLIAWEDYREGLSRRAEALTGQKVAIQGGIGLRLLPRPMLSLADTTLGPAPGDPVLEIERVDLQLETLPLLLGEAQIQQVRLVRPVLHLRAAPDGTLEGLSALAPLASDPIGPRRLTVVDGRVRIRHADGAEAVALEQVAFELLAEGQRGPYAIEGELGIAGQPLSFEAQLGRIDEASATLQVEMSTPLGGGAASGSFRGLASWAEGTPELEGELDLRGDDARATVAMLGRIAGAEPPPLPPWADAPFSLEAQLNLGRDRVRLDQARLDIAGREASGELELALAPEPSLDLAVELGRIELPDPPDAEDLGLAVAAALPPGLSGKIDLSVDSLGYRGGAIRRLRATLLLSGSGRLTIEQARALLPGRADVSFTGVLVADAADPELHGTLTTVTNDLRGGLAWLGIQAAGIPDDRLRTFSLSGALSIDRDSLRLAEAEIRLDATRVTGSAAVGLGPRRQIAAVLEADRLNLDGYRRDWAPEGLAANLRALLGDLDLALEAEVGRLIAGGQHLEGLVIDARSVDDRVRLEELSVRGPGEASARISGEVDLESGSFDLAASLDAERPASLLRRLGADPPLILARLTPLALRGSARGTPEAFDLDLELRHEAARLAVLGDAGWAEGEARYDLAIDAGHPDLPQLLRGLGVVYGSADEGEPKPFSLAGKLQRGASAGITIVGSARLGATTLTGRIGWRETPGRPRVSAELSLGEPQAEDLLALASLAGLRLEPPLLGEPPVGNWPSDALLLAWMSELDGELELSAKGGVVGPGLRLAARLDDRRLVVDELTASLWGGDAEIQALLDARRRLPFMALAVDLRAIDPTRFGDWLDLAPVVQGSADLSLEATAAGSSLRELVRSLLGRIDVTLRDGRLALADGMELREALRAPPDRGNGAPPDGQDADGAIAGAEPIPLNRLAGSFQVKRGIASVESVRVALDGVEGRLLGEVDLLIWAADLRLELARRAAGADGAVVLQLVGPLDRPQVWLQQPERLSRPRLPDPP